MKPNHLSRGIGVRVLKRNGDLFTDINEDTLTISDLANEAEILLGLGKYKGGSRIILEERIRAHPDFNVDDIPDIRMIYYRNKFLFCVARMPSRESQGYANISRGATCGIVLNSGRYINNDARFQNNSILSGELPFFEDLVSTGKRVTQVFGIAFQSVDMTVNERGDVVVIESDSLPQSISDDRLTLQGIDWLNAVMRNDLKHQSNEIFIDFKLEESSNSVLENWSCYQQSRERRACSRLILAYLSHRRKTMEEWQKGS